MKKRKNGRKKTERKFVLFCFFPSFFFERLRVLPEKEREGKKKGGQMSLLLSIGGVEERISFSPFFSKRMPCFSVAIVFFFFFFGRTRPFLADGSRPHVSQICVIVVSCCFFRGLFNFFFRLDPFFFAFRAI